MTENLTTDAEITWCPGCGNFGIHNAFQKAVTMLDDEGIKQDSLVLTSGIGCHGKIIDYLAVSGLYSIHGRSMTTAEGIKFANPNLSVVCFAGDGDGYGEGLAHLIFAAKRNADITVIVHNNGAYALTTGQFSPTSQKGFKGPSSPMGNVEEPLNPLTLMLEAGASFVARGYAGNLEHLTALIVQAVKHPGFALIDVLQPSVVFNNTYKKYNEKTEEIDETPEELEKAITLAKTFEDRIPIGVIYKKKRPLFHQELYGDWNPVEQLLDKKHRRKAIYDILKKTKI